MRSVATIANARVLAPQPPPAPQPADAEPGNNRRGHGVGQHEAAPRRANNACTVSDHATLSELLEVSTRFSTRLETVDERLARVDAELVRLRQGLTDTNRALTDHTGTGYQLQPQAQNSNELMWLLCVAIVGRALHRSYAI